MSFWRELLFGTDSKVSLTKAIEEVDQKELQEECKRLLRELQLDLDFATNFQKGCLAVDMLNTFVDALGYPREFDKMSLKQLRVVKTRILRLWDVLEPILDKPKPPFSPPRGMFQLTKVTPEANWSCRTIFPSLSRGVPQLTKVTLEGYELYESQPLNTMNVITYKELESQPVEDYAEKALDMISKVAKANSPELGERQLQFVDGSKRRISFVAHHYNFYAFLPIIFIISRHFGYGNDRVQVDIDGSSKVCVKCNDWKYFCEEFAKI